MLDIWRGSAGGAVSLEVAIKKCARAKHWSAALQLLREVHEGKLEASVITYNAGISACGKGGQWQRALSLLSGMSGAQIEPSVRSYSAGISACQKAAQWQTAILLIREMRGAKLEPDGSPGQLHRWDQCVREGRAVAAGFGSAQRDVGCEAGA
ncbi:unnamed protein product [Prorocentrum cordatum]|uniref:Pentatricopeptide repeat-containing protein, chloroplastic n=1 Tax=Prorocentrum cordatum TaxID=2364126 RepID=A0ABN9QGH1_9DINO|nr:unnamed protein product [Polarella glacialis]